MALTALCAGCTATNFQMQLPADMTQLPDMATADQAQAPDLADAAEDLAGVDFSGADLLRPPDMVQAPDLAGPPGDLATCGGEGHPCCGGVTMGAGNTYCAAPQPVLNCWDSTCQQCGAGGTTHQPCCGGNAVTHVGGTCYTGICQATGALAGHCG